MGGKKLIFITCLKHLSGINKICGDTKMGLNAPEFSPVAMGLAQADQQCRASPLCFVYKLTFSYVFCGFDWKQMIPGPTVVMVTAAKHRLFWGEVVAARWLVFAVVSSVSRSSAGAEEGVHRLAQHQLRHHRLHQFQRRLPAGELVVRLEFSFKSVFFRRAHARESTFGESRRQLIKPVRKVRVGGETQRPAVYWLKSRKND